MRETANQIANRLADKSFVLSQFALRWGPIYRSYTAHAWYWSPLLLLRRFLYALTAVLLATNQARFDVFGILTLSSLLLHFKTKPFEDRRMNYVEMASYVLLTYLSMVLGSEVAPYSTGTQVLLTFLVIPPAVLLLIWLGFSHLSRLHQKFRSSGSIVAGDNNAKSDAEEQQYAASVESASSADGKRKRVESHQRPTVAVELPTIMR